MKAVYLKKGTKEHDRVLQMVKRGIPTPEIIKRTGHPRQAIAALKAHTTMGTYNAVMKRKAKKTESPRNARSSEQHDLVIRLVRKGLPTDRIVKEARCSPGTVAAIRAHETRGSYSH